MDISKIYDREIETFHFVFRFFSFSIVATFSVNTDCVKLQNTCYNDNYVLNINVIKTRD